MVAGQGVGAVAAALAAIDGSARLWEADGLWKSDRVRGLYGWKWPLRAAAWLMLLVVARAGGVRSSFLRPAAIDCR